MFPLYYEIVKKCPLSNLQKNAALKSDQRCKKQEYSSPISMND